MKIYENMNRVSMYKWRMSRCLAVLASALLCAVNASAQEVNASAQENTITIGGDVYGGGMNGAVGVGNTTGYLNDDGTVKEDFDTEEEFDANMGKIALKNVGTLATEVIINSGAAVRTVFGGGENGKAFGNTTVTVNGGDIGDEKWTGSVHGGVFGAGDGVKAIVMGHTKVVLNKGKIWNNVYGGGNQALLIGNPTVIIHGGTMYGNVFGSARMADCVGFAYVHFDVDNGSDGKTKQTDDLLIHAVYGGNDISGTSSNMTYFAREGAMTNWMPLFNGGSAGFGTAPFEAKARDLAIDNSGKPDYTGPIAVNNTNYSEGSHPRKSPWSSAVKAEVRTDRTKKFFVGNIFGGGNGDYDYTGGKITLIDDPDEGTTKEFAVASAPVSERTYLELCSGTYGYVYGGGNNVSVTTFADIYIDNPEAPCTIPLTEMERMGLQKTSYTVDGDNAVLPHTFDRVFGGNNLADMSIQPTWYLISGRINNLYGGGNKGRMTNENGILTYIIKDEVRVNNLYGGCRMADVDPATQGEWISGGFNWLDNGAGKYAHQFEKGYAARLYVSAGHINNVYGGNDIAGDVMYGSDVELMGAVSGDIYGGGNGAYPYTDNKELAENYPDEYGDYFYDAEGHFATWSRDGKITNGNLATSSAASLDGMNAIRPNTQNTLVHIAGQGEVITEDKWNATYKNGLLEGGTVAKLTLDGKTQISSKSSEPGILLEEGGMLDTKRIYVTGALYCGGNSASVLDGGMAKIKLGRCVTVDNLFMGSNGAEMVKAGLLEQYKNGVTLGETTYPLAKFDLTVSADMAEYMKGCEMSVIPTIEYETDNADDVSTNPDADRDPEGLNFSTRIGSFYCGGNVGSMNINGTMEIDFPRELVIYNKVVGGCNNANVRKTEYNAFYAGGVIGAPGAKDASVENDPGLKVKLYVPCRMEPRLLVYDRDDEGFVKVNTSAEIEPWSAPAVISDYGIESDKVGVVHILDRGNIYGGCYESGHTNGSVQIDIKDELCATPQMRAYFGDAPFQDSENDGTAKIVDNMRRYVLNHGWSAFGGGYGTETEIWGNVYMNMSRNAGYINAYGGGELGFVGQITRDADGVYQMDAPASVVTRSVDEEGNVTEGSKTVQKYAVTKAYDTYINLERDIHRSPVSIFGLNAIYGGGYQGIVTGNTHVYAGGGLHYDVFGGACNADIYGATEVFVGVDRSGGYTHNLQLRHNVYGGNDFGGQIFGTMNHEVKVKGGTYAMNADGTSTLSTDAGDDTQKTKTITSNTYVQYLGGMIERSVLGGSCGLYRYDEEYTWTGEEGVSQILVGKELITPVVGQKYRLYPESLMSTMPTLYKEVAATEGYNTFVDVDCQYQNQEHDAILADIYGGGYGMCDEIGRVDAKHTYVLLHSLENSSVRIANTVYGGGYFSYVENSKVDAVSGRVRDIYGGTCGTTVDANVAEAINQETIAAVQKEWKDLETEDADDYEVRQEIMTTQLTKADYTSKNSEVNVYPALNAYSGLNIYGAGAFTGSENTVVNLFGGNVNEVYGGSNKEGVSGTTVVNVPTGSAINMTALYGGSHGSYAALPCDVYSSNVNFYSSDAIVSGGKVFGGNNAYRASRTTNVKYYANAKTATGSKGQNLDIFGAGNGVNSVAGKTNVTLYDGAVALNVYGGGFAGAVFAKYDILNDGDYDASNYIPYTKHDDGTCLGQAYGHWYMTGDDYHTNVSITANAQVLQNVCGAGYGPESVVAGKTLVTNYGTVDEDIYGGGYNGSVRKMVNADTGYTPNDTEDGSKQNEYTVATNVRMMGGVAANVYGGGFSGPVGGTYENGGALVVYETEVTDASDVIKVTDFTASSNVFIGVEKDDATNADGVPAISHSVYGSGNAGAVYGTSYVTMDNGYVGYDYRQYTDAEWTAMSESQKEGLTREGKYYIERVKIQPSATSNLLADNGNLFGGGYGEYARALNSHVRLNGGVIRNSLYGGGEMAAIGWGTVQLDPIANDLVLKEIQYAGISFVEMYGGEVHADAFGGGRGYAIDGNGRMDYGKNFRTDGYVFGNTDINVYRGTVGTDLTVLEINGSHGNVFGGGNIGYVYGAGKELTGDEYTAIATNENNPNCKIVGDGYYYVKNADGTFYTHPTTKLMKLTEDSRVNIMAYGKAMESVTIPYSVEYHAGFTVPALIMERMKKAANWNGPQPASLSSLINDNNEVITDFTFSDNGEFAKGELIPNEALNSLTNGIAEGDPTEHAAIWEKIDDSGIVIKNAVFGGGNVSKGSDKVYAFSNTVLGNSTASIVDVYCRDLIEVGSEGIGGLYGDGNLTFVDGYRELNVTNYGTDYWALTKELQLARQADEETYNSLTPRQRAFYTVKYICAKETSRYDQASDKRVTYKVNDLIDQEELKLILDYQRLLASTSSAEEAIERNIDPSGWTYKWDATDIDVKSRDYFTASAAIINEGRYLNTVQRADYCGLKGSRVVLKGAMDRAFYNAEEIDYTKYTFNRIGELSLNQNNKTDGSNLTKQHGSYVGIYSLVKYLASMSSDKNFVTGLSDAGAGTAGIAQSSIRETNSAKEEDAQNITVDFNTSGEPVSPVTKHLYQPGKTSADDAYTFFEWKVKNYNKNNRNNGTSPNKLALASGVYLELISGYDDKGDKIYGPIIGVVELDLLNVSPGEGGGFVYAKNHHGLPHFDAELSYASTLSDANYHLKTCRAYSYDDDKNAPALFNGVETSGNFVHSSKRIVDDCFPTTNSYVGAGNITDIKDAAPAHYWYLKGDYYVYDQLISAYTGAAHTYNATLKLPLDVTGKQEAKIRLLNVLPGLYLSPDLSQYHPAEGDEEAYSDPVTIHYTGQDKQFGNNEPVSFWDWRNMSQGDRNKFLLETYNCRETVADESGMIYYEGQGITDTEYNGFGDDKLAYDEDGNEMKDESGNTLKLKSFFNPSNLINKDAGFVLSVDLTNPNVWNDRYSKYDVATGKVVSITKEAYEDLSDVEKKAYASGASFTSSQDGVYGQATYSEGKVISEGDYGMQATLLNNLVEAGKTDLKAEVESKAARFENAYVVIMPCEVTYKDGTVESCQKGFTMSEDEFANNIQSVVAYLEDETSITDKTKIIEPAYICVNTVEVAEKDYRYMNTLIGKTEYDKYAAYTEDSKFYGVASEFQPAHYCTGGPNADGTGTWGGNYFMKNGVYNALDVCRVKDEERQYFTYNYDALDLLRTDYKPYNKVDFENVPADVKGSSDIYDYLYRMGEYANADVAAYDGDEQSLYQKVLDIDINAKYTGTTEFTMWNDDKSDSKSIAAGTVLHNEQYNSLPNDRKNYAQIAVSIGDIDGENYVKYIIKETFETDDKIYNAGQVIDKETYESLHSGNPNKIEKLMIPTTNGVGPFYYCIKDYYIGSKDKYVSEMGTTNPFGSAAITTLTYNDKSGGTISNGEMVSAGTLINATTMENNVPNYQKDFALSSTAPNEETTLYVPVTADINNLMQDRYITAIYEYEYSESNDGIKFETFTEKHIINIRLKFLYGQPTIGPLTPPDIVLPLENIAMPIPYIEEGAFPIIGAGWEIYSSEENAKKHRNGKPYSNGYDPLYWYQNGYYIAYYAETKLGRAYSTPVPFTVANYHRLRDVINDPNHMYIDHSDCDRDPKIYLENNSVFDVKAQKKAVVAATGVNELDALRQLFKLTNTNYGKAGGFITEEVEVTPEKEGDPVTITKTILRNNGREITGCKGLEFFFQDDYAPTTASWEPIGSDDELTDADRGIVNMGCFEGNINGNGHTVTGLDNSLFGSLCGNVYNLGVMGSFKAPGIADDGNGRAENCWVWTTAAKDDIKNVNAIMGSGNVVNGFYPATNGFKTTAGATPREPKDFLNGKVAYDLNRFYLTARYYVQPEYDNNEGAIELTSNNAALYREADGNIAMGSSEGARIPMNYAINYAAADGMQLYFGFDQDKSVDISPKYGYVENLYRDGDFRFADGLKPTKDDLRQIDEKWLPIYPDDYIFFGQKLSYKLYNADDDATDLHPVAVAKDKTVTNGTKVDNTKSGLIADIEKTTNRVYRAPAYYRNGTYGESVEFNRYAAFRDNITVQKFDEEPETLAENVFKSDGYIGTEEGEKFNINHHLTAIDFTGQNDGTWTLNDGKYKPLLDIDALQGIKTNGLTRNLLIYAPSPAVDKDDKVINDAAATVTNKTLRNYFTEPKFNDYDKKGNSSASVSAADATNSVQVAPEGNVMGHMVELVAKGDDAYFQAVGDQLLVDKNDFYAPFGYKMTKEQVMWYQRTPDLYAAEDKGWEGISLPFAAVRVATQDKGEITHFYDDSKTGHEYWLREYQKMNDGGEEVATADFNSIKYDSNGHSVKSKVDANKFLYNYYYMANDFNDANLDEYQKYYSEARTYGNYPCNEPGTPYIVGYPGAEYYEFDLSGTFEPKHTATTAPAKLPAQTISYVSDKGIAIAATDEELTALTDDGYSFVANYLNEMDRNAEDVYYSMKGDGSGYDQDDAFKSVAFRPYFYGQASSTVKATRSIVFGQSDENSDEKPITQRDGNDPGKMLKMYVRDHKLVVESTYETRLNVYYISGQFIKRIDVKEGTNTYDGFRPGFYIIGNRKIHFAPGNY